VTTNGNGNFNFTDGKWGPVMATPGGGIPTGAAGSWQPLVVVMAQQVKVAGGDPSPTHPTVVVAQTMMAQPVVVLCPPVVMAQPVVATPAGGDTGDGNSPFNDGNNLLRWW